jgi:replicative DNA helicase
MSASLDRLPPQDIDAEMSVLGAMLLGNALAAEDGAHSLKVEDFYRPAHGRIFAAMRRLIAEGNPVDVVTLKDELNREGILDSVGGIGYLVTLGEFVPSTANLLHYAKIVESKATARRLIEAAGEIAGAAFRGETSAEALTTEAERIISEAARIGSHGDGWQNASTMLYDEMGEMEERYRSGSRLVGVTTGLQKPDSLTLGLRRSELAILGAPPSCGKTSLVMTNLSRAALAGARCAFFSLEMSRQMVAQRWMADYADVPLDRVLQGDLSGAEWQRAGSAVERLHEAMLSVDDQAGLTPSQIRSRSRRLAAKWGGIDLIVVDYLQLMGPDEDDWEGKTNTVKRVGRAAGELKKLAKELNCAVVALSQLSRTFSRRDDKRPILTDLRESGDVEAHADCVQFLYRASYFAAKEQQDDSPQETPAPTTSDETEFIVAKQRNGKTGMVKIGFQGAFCRFVNLIDEPGQPGGGF